MRKKALLFDFFGACVVLGAACVPVMAAAFVAIVHFDASPALAMPAVVGVFVVAMAWVARYFDLPMPPWRARHDDRSTPGKRRYSAVTGAP